MKRNRFLIPIAIIAVAACSSYRGSPQAPLIISDPQVELGLRVFHQHCQQCHPGGSTGIGPGIVNKPLPDWAIRFQVRHGLGQMPAFPEETISDHELTALVDYLNALRSHYLSMEET